MNGAMPYGHRLMVLRQPREEKKHMNTKNTGDPVLAQGDHILPWSVPASLFPRSFSVTALKLVQLPPSSWNSITSSDMVIIDTSDLDAMRAGLFALDQGNHIRVRHLEQVSASAEDIIVSGLHDQQYQTLPSHLSILGRVVFQASLFPQSQSAAMA
jgi:hypothetical protein